MIRALILFLITTTAFAYVPTVESIFRHGSNPDVTTNASNITFKVTKMNLGEVVQSKNINDSALLSERTEDFYKIFFTKTNEVQKLAQTRYSNSSFSESSLEHKLYYPNFTGYTVRPSIEHAEKGIFIGLLHSLVLNDGEVLINYLKSLGVPVKLNSELLNREKVEFLAGYKKYLVTINKDRSARNTEPNPMRPTDKEARERVNQIMKEPMYVDTKQVKLSKDEGSVAWVVNAGPIEAVASYRNREIQRLKYKTAAGDLEIICKDYYLANGTHSIPRYLLIRTFNGEHYQVELTNLRHYNEKESDLVKRLNNWDKILKGKESTDPRPEFLL